MYPLGCFSCNRVNCVNPLHESDKVLFESTFQVVINTLFLHDVQISMSRPGYINVLSGIGNVSSFGT